MWRSAWSRPTPNKSASAGGLPLPSRASLNTPGFAATRARGLPFGAVVSGLPPFGCSRGATGVQQRGNRGAAEGQQGCSREQQGAAESDRVRQNATGGVSRTPLQQSSATKREVSAAGCAPRRGRTAEAPADGGRRQPGSGGGSAQCSTRLRKPSSSASSRCCAGQLLRRLPSNRLLSRFPVKR